MTRPLKESTVKSVLLDVEGTTTPISFVYEVLFPYARARVEDFLAAHSSSGEVCREIHRLREEQAEDQCQGFNPPAVNHESREALLASVAAYVHWLMDRDRKSTPLKALQGRIWEEGYRQGELKSQVFADVPPGLERWWGQGKEICIFSSGSVLAQKLLFAHTTAGDLTGFIHGYFDTNVGAKTDAESYRRIAAALQWLPAEVLFISDVTAELDAARSAGMQTALCLRPGNHPQPPVPGHIIIHTFDKIFPPNLRT